MHSLSFAIDYEREVDTSYETSRIVDQDLYELKT